MIFPGTEVRLTGWWFPGSSFLLFLKMGAISVLHKVAHAALLVLSIVTR